LTGTDVVRLVAGEDIRYTLKAPGIDRWLPDFLRKLDGTKPLAILLEELPHIHRESAGDVIARLRSERVLTDAPAASAHSAGRYRLQIEGRGALCDAMKALVSESSESKVLRLFCQDNLDYKAALNFNADCLKGESPFLWATTGPMSRGYVSPVFLPDAGPCLECMVRHFQRLSPAPEIYEHLMAQRSQIVPSSFPEHGLDVMKHLIFWKVSLMTETPPPPAQYRLHVLEIASLEISSHRVFADPECPACQPLAS
jgi:bacteriocin biosynthesis cyclodehydratase domain-containing protein